MEIFDKVAPELNETELRVAADNLQHPAVKKYLNHLMLNEIKGLVFASPKEGQSDAEFIRLEAAARGRIEGLMTLLSIGADENQQDVN